MARYTSSQYRTEQPALDPFELELTDDPTLPVGPDHAPRVVTFHNPNDMEAGTAFDLATNDDPRQAFEAMLGDDFAPFWQEWRRRPVRELNKLLADVMAHYGADQGKPARSSR